MKIVIFGVGLIGGSFALALKQAKVAKKIIGVGRTRASLDNAISLGVIDAIGDADAVTLNDADIVMLAMPVGQMGEVMARIAPHLGANTIVADAGSTKQDVVALAYQHLAAHLARFVPAHPIAGGEVSGASAARADLYRNKKVVITPLKENSLEAIKKIHGLWQACGAEVREMPAAQHDAVFAAVSHLPHLLAYALVHDIANRPNAEVMFDFAAGGFRDFTRIAGSHPEMWRDISLANRDALLKEIDSYLNEVSALRKLVEQRDAAGLEKLFEFARDARAAWLAKLNHKMTMQYLDLPPVKKVQGTVALPGSKSISNRTLLLAAICEGATEIKNLLESDDTKVMLDALTILGVKWQRHGDSDDYRVEGIGGVFPVKQADLFMGNAGTAIRPLCAALALSGGDYRLSGVPRMHERPIGDLVDGLRQIGAEIDYLGNAGFPPLRIKPASIHWQENIKVRGDVSSQFLTALLMALPLAKQNVTIEVVGELISKPYVEITLNLMQRFGVKIERNGWQRFTIAGDQAYRSPTEISVEGDASSASYFLAAGAIAGGPVRVTGVGKNSIQGDVRFADSLQQMGAQVAWGDDWIEVRSAGKLKAIDADFNHIPDAAMTIAVAALFADGTTTLRNIASWRVKETDRIAAVATELRKLGATVEEGADFLRVTPPQKILPASIDTYDDHRMAMAFSLASLGGTAIRINDPQCVNKTFPDYFAVFDKIKNSI